MVRELGEMQSIIFNAIGYGTEEEWMVARNLPTSSELQMEINKTQEGTYLLVIRPPKGNNIIIENADLEQLSMTMKIIQLNVEKDRITGNNGLESVSNDRVKINGNGNCRDKKVIEQIQSLCKDILTLSGITELDIELFESYDDFMDYVEDLYYEEGIKLDINSNPVIKLKLDLLKELDEIVDTYIFSSLEDVRIGGEKLESSKEVGDFLIKNARSEEFNGAVDLSSYPDEIQNYLLNFFYNKNIKLTAEELKGINAYKGASFALVNELLRGKFEKIMSSAAPSNTLEEACETIIEVSSAMESMPSRKYDLVIGRKGKGISKNLQTGEENQYDSFVSYGTNDGTSTGNGVTSYTYKRVLSKEVSAIPMELVCTPEILSQVRDENEILVNPFTFEVSKTERNGNDNIVVMTNEQEMDVKAILVKRLKELAAQYPRLETIIQAKIQELEGARVQQKDSQDTQTPEQILEETVKHYGEKGGLRKINSLVSKVRSQIKDINDKFMGEK